VIAIPLAAVFLALFGLLMLERHRSKSVSRQHLSRVAQAIAHGQLEEASHLISKLEKTSSVLDFEALLLRRMGRLDEVEALADGSLPMRAERAKLLAQQADAMRTAGSLELALPLYEQALATHPLPRIQLARAELLAELSRSQEAEAAFRDVLERGHTLPAILGYGELLERQERFNEALTLYQAPRVWERGDARLLRQAGICALHLEQYRFAEKYLREALGRGQKSAKTYAYLGYSLECQRDWEKSQEIYWELTHRHPGDAAGYRGLAWLYGVGLSRNLEAPAALRMARRAVELHPDVSSWEILSACEARAGNLVEAEQIQQRLAEAGDARHLAAMEALRSGQLLDEQHLARTLVA
jgi:tetratricopeptide (TPR) repeat protein